MDLYWTTKRENKSRIEGKMGSTADIRASVSGCVLLSVCVCG